MKESWTAVHDVWTYHCNFISVSNKCVYVVGKLSRQVFYLIRWNISKFFPLHVDYIVRVLGDLKQRYNIMRATNRRLTIQQLYKITSKTLEVATNIRTLEYKS